MSELIEMPAQGTPEWLEQRRGCITASRFGDVMAKGRGKGKPWGDTAMSYAIAIACERVTGQTRPSFSNAATQWGHDHEALAVAAYEETQGVQVDSAPFLEHPLYDHVGGSCDGFVGRDGIIEVKCPFNEEVHLKTVWAGCMPGAHMAQVQGNLWVSGRKWCDFISYQPNLPESCGLFVSRVERDPEFIQELADRVEAFAGLVSEMVEVFCGDK